MQEITKDISLIDINNSFFTFTSKKKINNIFKNGLVSKTLFVKGEVGIIKMLDEWLQQIMKTKNKFKKIKNNLIYEESKYLLTNRVFLLLDLSKIYIHQEDDEKIQNIYSKKMIKAENIKILKDQNIFDASVILNKIISRNIEYVKNNCKFLYDYYIYLQKIEKLKIRY